MPLSGLLRPCHRERRGAVLARVVAVAAVLDLAAGTGIAYLAGLSRVGGLLAHVRWAWLVVAAGSLLVSFAGYLCAYQDIFRVDGGLMPQPRQLCALVVADFGGLLAHGNGALDRDALGACGHGQDEARVRVGCLAGMEQGMLALAGCAAAIAVLTRGLARPGDGFTLPWAIVPVPGFVLGLWAAARYAGRFRGRPGWRGRLGIFLASAGLIGRLFGRPLRWWRAIAGMALFWAADALAVWAAMAAFGFRMDLAGFFVGFATGMVFTRRAGPLGGAGILVLVLPLTIWHSGAPMAAAAASVFTYRVLCVWLPLPAWLAVLPILQEMRPRRAIPDQRPAFTAFSAQLAPAFVRALQTAGLGALALLAFLVCDSFSRRFPRFGYAQHGIYVSALVLAALAAALLLVPAACYRRMSSRRSPERMSRRVNGMAAGGLAAAGLAVSAAVRLAARCAGSGLAAGLAGASAAAMFAVIWFVLPALLGRKEAHAYRPPADDAPDGK
jgi:Family of unknown function (DUF6328)